MGGGLMQIIRQNNPVVDYQIKRSNRGGLLPL